MPRYFVLREGVPDDTFGGTNRISQTKELLSAIPGAAVTPSFDSGELRRNCCDARIFWQAFEVTSNEDLTDHLIGLTPQGLRFFTLEDSESEEELRRATMAYFGQTAE